MDWRVPEPLGDHLRLRLWRLQPPPNHEFQTNGRSAFVVKDSLRTMASIESERLLSLLLQLHLAHGPRVHLTIRWVRGPREPALADIQEADERAYTPARQSTCRAHERRAAALRVAGDSVSGRRGGGPRSSACRRTVEDGRDITPRSGHGQACGDRAPQDRAQDAFATTGDRRSYPAEQRRIAHRRDARGGRARRTRQCLVVSATGSGSQRLSTGPCVVVGAGGAVGQHEAGFDHHGKGDVRSGAASGRRGSSAAA